MKKNRSTIILILIFLVGLSVMLYPTVSDYVNQRHQSRALASYDETVNEMSDADYTAYFEAAVAICRPGSIIVVDNVVRRGAIAHPEDDHKDTVGSRRVIEAAAHDPRVIATVLQTVGRRGHDGMLIATVL